jgi:hypothetical protein
VIAGLRGTGWLTGNAVEGDGLYLKNCSGFVRIQERHPRRPMKRLIEAGNVKTKGERAG